MKKIIFLDVDGTLVDYNETMPDSTKEAIIEAKKNGHYLVISTGRTYTTIYKWLLDIGFDGVIASAGAHIVWNNEEIYHTFIPRESLRKVDEVLRRHNSSYLFQGHNGRFMDKKNYHRIETFFKKIIPKFNMNKFQATISDTPFERDDIESGVFHDCESDIFQIEKELGDLVQITGASFGEDRLHNGEFTKLGVNKATGVQRVIDHIGMSIEDTIAFGDSPNDFEMLQYVNVGVAMGNGTEEIKEISNMVTTSILDDGIYNGFKKLGLI